MSQFTAGSCLCGDVQYEITGAFDAFFLCHCKRCRKGTGTAHAANLFSSTATIRWIAGRDDVRSYRVPESRHQKSFCGRCGSAVPTEKRGLLVVPAGGLDTEVDIRPNAHICCESRADWDDGFADVPCLDGLPG
ncbi:GFA family protein [Hoeflea sp. WL0058]|uniref:GFA family protein n=1 Tax=Flavimaribacter sediminis TaxID=2865987 RepID=A0AAE2ZN05_9HYPH|nr:GFA family protein [Flavimaribacter sediminis]MBW8638924.1 GFA family protein [Flavimaribacter sediminis]